MSLSTLLGLDDQPADLAGYGPITADTARGLASHPDATWRRLVTDPLTGALLDYGRSTYRPPADLRDFVLARDAICAYPHCGIPARLCQIDYIDPYHRDPAKAGGQTSATNTAPLCVRNHQGKTRRHWNYLRDINGSYLGTNTRTGHTYRSHLPQRWNHPTGPTRPVEPTGPSDPTQPSGPIPTTLPVAEDDSVSPPY